MIAESQSTDVPDLLVLREGLPLDEVARRIGLARAIAGVKHRVVAFYLAEVDARGLHQLAGYRTTAQWAAARFDMSRREARDLLAAGRALRELPGIDRAFAEGRLCWSKARELIKVATPQHEQAWIETAAELSVDELILEVRLARHGDAPRRRDQRKGLPEIRLTLEAKLPPEVWARWEQVKKKLSDESRRPLEEWECLEALIDLGLAMRDDGTVPGKERGAPPSYTVVVCPDTSAAPEGDGAPPTAVETDDGLVPIPSETAELISCSADRFDETAPDHETERRIPEPLRRSVLARDRYRCRACDCRHRLQLHHVVPWSEGGPSVASNLVTLCRGCHALIHAELLRIEGSAKKGWRFTDGAGQDIGAAPQRPAELLDEAGGGGTRLELPEPPPPAAPGGAVEAGTVCHTRGPSPLRPHRFDEVIGQREVVADLEQAVRVAREHGEPLGHTLLTGGRGLGKTTIAGAAAAEMGVDLTAAPGPHVDDAAALIGLLSGLRDREVLFVDEIHAMPRAVAEILYQAMDDGRLSLAGSAGSGTVCLPRFTLIGATTEPGALTGSLISRFENVHWLRPYDAAALTRVIERAAGGLGIEIDSAAAGRLAGVARGTPREALRLLRKARQQARDEHAAVIDDGVAARTLARIGIDGQGLLPLDRAYLDILGGHGPVGLARLATMLGVDERVLARDHEPHLFRLGLATTTPHGRVALHPRMP